MPLPFSRKTLPLCVPEGIFIFTLPSSVGTSICARRAAPLAWLALAGQLEPRAGVHSGGHLHAEHALVLQLARPLARLAGVGDHLAGPLAVPARTRDLEEPLREPQLAG